MTAALKCGVYTLATPPPPPPPPPMQKYCNIRLDKNLCDALEFAKMGFENTVSISDIHRAGNQVILTIHVRCQTSYILQMDTVCSER